jgi:hypothetical protein
MKLSQISFTFWSYSLFILVALLPWFSLISQVLGGFDSTVLLLWKELIVTINILSGVFLIGISKRRFLELHRYNQVAIVTIIVVILTSVSWGVFRAVSYDLPIFNIALGIRFEWFWLFWLCFYLCWYLFDHQRLLSNLAKLPIQILSWLIIGGFLVQGLIAVIFGQQQLIDFLTMVDSARVLETISCNPIDFGIESCRLQGVFNSPNHFAGVGLYSLTLLLLKLIQPNSKKQTLFYLTLTLLNLIFIYLTYSRYAWFGAGLLVATTLASLLLKRFKLWSLFFIKFSFISQWTLSIFAIVIFLLGFSSFLSFLPGSVIKPSSSTEHVRHMQVARDIILISPSNFWLGFGLGSSGPLANPIYYDGDQAELNPIVRNHGSISLKYGLLPHRSAIPESWFLQVWLNGGILYLIVYALLSCSAYILFLYKSVKFKSQYYILAGTGFLTIIIGNLILHIWENQSISLGMTLLFLIFLGLHNSQSTMPLKNLS